MSDHTSKTSDPNGDSSGGPGSDAPVLFERRGALGRVVLNRPKAINALTTPMVTALHEQLQAWADDDTVRAVSLEGAGPKGLCAGGDMRAVRESALAGDDAAMTFFTREYAVWQFDAGIPWTDVQVFDSSPVWWRGTLYLFFAGAPTAGDADNLSAQIGVATLSW